MIIPGAGNYTFVFQSQVLGRPDQNGVQQLQPLTLQHGLVGPNPVAAPSDQLFGEFELQSPSAFNVKIRDGAGTLVDHPFTVAVW